MIWLLLPKDMRDPNSVSTSFVPLDGDMKEVRLADPSVDFGKREIGSTMIWASGRWIDPTFAPTRMSIAASHSGLVKSGGAPLPDFVHCLFAQLVSSSFREIVKTHDPGRHQFLPVRMEWRSGEWVGRDHYWMAPGNRVFAMDVDRTRPPMTEIRTGEGWVNPRPLRPAKRFPRAQPVDTWNPVFLKEEIGDAHLFCDGELDGYIFVTDQLRAAIEAAGLTGVRFLGPYELV